MPSRHPIHNPINVCVVGSGMYVTGRGTEGFGTIMPALFEAQKAGLVNAIALVCTSLVSLDSARIKMVALSSKMGVCPDISYLVGSLSSENLSWLVENGYKSGIVAVPDQQHYNICKCLIECNIHCLVVKPMAPTVSEAVAMTKLASKHKLIGQVEFHKRYDESNRVLKDAIAQGRLGDLLYAVIEYSQPKCIPQDYFKNWSASTSIFQYLGVHYVDLIQHMTGFVPRAVTAWGQKSFLQAKGIDTYDAMQVVVRWSGSGGQFVSTHMTNWIDSNRGTAVSDQKITVVGTKGRLSCDQKHRGVQMVTDDAGLQDINPYFTHAYGLDGEVRFEGYGIQSVLQFLQDVRFFHAGEIGLEQLNRERPSFEQCQWSTLVVELAHRSLNLGGQTVWVKEYLDESRHSELACQFN